MICLHKARSAVRCSASRVRRMNCSLLRAPCEVDLHMDDSFNEGVCFGGGKWGGVLDRRDILDLMHGRGRIAVNSRIPTMPGRSMSTGQTLVAPSAKRREVSGESHEG